MADLGNIDTSMYGDIQPIKVPDILGMASRFAETQNAFNQNIIARRTIAAKQAFGQIIQQSIGPDGQPDYAKAAVMMSANPATAWAAPEFIHDMAINKGLQIDNVSKGIEQAFRQQDAIAQAFAPLLTKGANITKADLNGAAGQLVASGLLGPPQQAMAAVVNVLNGLPESGPGLYEAVNQYAMRSKQTAETLQNVWGRLGEIDFGPGVNFFRGSALMGITPMGTMMKGLSPAELNAPITVLSQPGDVDAQGNPIPPGTPRTQRTGNSSLPLVGGQGGGMPTGGGALSDNGVAPAQGQAPMGVAPPAGTVVAPPSNVRPTTPHGAANGGGPSATTPPITSQVGPPTSAGRDAAIAAAAGQPPAVSTGVPGYVEKGREQYQANRQAVAASIADGTSQQLQMKEFLKQMGPGGITTSALGPIRERVGAYLKATGLFPDDVTAAIANGSVPGSQIAAKLSATNTFQTLHQLLGGQNRVTNLFISELEKVLPSIATDPKAVVDIFRLFGQMYDVQRLELSMYDTFEHKYHMDPADIPGAWAQWLNGKKGIAAIDRIMTSKPAIMEPEASQATGQGTP